MEKAIVLVSGGINSAVAAAITREQYEVYLMHLAWGHRTAERELQCFEQISEFLRVDRKLVAEVPFLGTLAHNSRTSRKIHIEDMAALGKEVPTTFVLGLIPTMLSLAATWAGSVGAKRIIIGTSEDHNTPGPRISRLYPDYRREFLQTVNLMLEYGKPANRELVVEAPLAELTRQEVVLLGRRLKVPFESTWSCYRSNDEPCAKCLGCSTRAAGFMRCSTPDPLMLETTSRAL